MIPFSYRSGDSVKSGKIKVISSVLPIEADIDANGWNFHIIVGKHSTGNYICIPNWSIGSELASLGDVFWNRERLASYTSLSMENASLIATALAELQNITRSTKALSHLM